MLKNNSKESPYGSWKSPITPGIITEVARIFNELAIDGEKGEIYWIEVRPDEEGRCVIVKEDNGTPVDITPAGFSALNTVYDYGGGAMAVSDGTVYFSNDPGIGSEAQKLYKKEPGKRPLPLTNPLNLRYGDLVIDKTHDRLICIRENHLVLQKNYPLTDIVGIDWQGIKEQQVLVPAKNDDLKYTRDYYSSPSISPSGKKLAWLAWNFGRMPWDSNELWTADIKKDGSLDKKSIKKIAGDTDASELKEGASFFQPQWGPDDNLYFVYDHDFSKSKRKYHNWWNLYRFNTKENVIERILENPPKNAEFGTAQWTLGMSCYDFLSPTEIIAAYNIKSEWCLGYIDINKKTLSPLEIEFNVGTEAAHKKVSNIEHVRIHAGTGNVVFCAGGPYQLSSIVSFKHKPGKNRYTLTVLREGSDRQIFKAGSKEKKALSGYISEGKPIMFPTTGGGQAHAFYYPPQNVDYHAPETEKPPLLIIAHGGPTAAATRNLNMELQYFSSRGFAVVDVNYRGSTGFGREFRLSLYRNWGIFDRDDCVRCAEYVAKENNFAVDKKRVISRGKSAGGYLTMVLATFTRLLRAGASYAGISDLTFIRDQTDKLEAYYAIELVTERDNPVKEFEIRSPINNIDLLECPMIFFQGELDGIVPPGQTKMMVDALRKKGKPVEMVLFPDESHHFHKAKNIIKSLEDELKFYSENLGFELPDES